MIKISFALVLLITLASAEDAFLSELESAMMGHPIPALMPEIINNTTQNYTIYTIEYNRVSGFADPRLTYRVSRGYRIYYPSNVVNGSVGLPFV